MTEAMQVGAFVAQLAAKQPTPGGGAAACVAAAIGNAAGAMACAYSQRKKDVESGAAAVAAETGSRLLAAGPRELSAADEDAAAYGALQATWAKDCALSNEAKAAVAAHALAVPVGLVERCHEHALLLKTFFPSCNPGIVSDAHVGANRADERPASCANEDKRPDTTPVPREGPSKSPVSTARAMPTA
ncbi:Formiminotransferase-cyclodeaminase-domain-containing protein [Pelagophyceae sp. CCMP2097]|nr:Formiminotransferase-cyclodeaminase-domain-containing protein [Pelagophyceae sp. CCMP2097]